MLNQDYHIDVQCLVQDGHCANKLSQDMLVFPSALASASIRWDITRVRGTLHARDPLSQRPLLIHTVPEAALWKELTAVVTASGSEQPKQATTAVDSAAGD